MRKLSKRAILVVSLGLVAIPMGVAAVSAYACTAVATLTDSPGAALAGSTVTISGSFFGTHDASVATSAGAVELRLGSLTGPVLANATPAGTDRSFSVQVTIPAGAAPGATFIAATQATASGTPVYGTPARQAFTVSAPATATAPLYGPVTLAMPAAPCIVPNVVGKSAPTAEAMLVVSHCGVGNISHPASKPKHSNGRKLVVVGTGLSAGTTAASGTKVNLTLRWQ
ncbi:MAG: hypothetical protein M3071_11700 [Actinomycetota bacterium]|nr:hypothetical protein [Actinomycetota bacterium]